VGDKSKTISLKELSLREDFYLEDVFYAVKEATDEFDLLERFRRICCDPIELDKVSKSPMYIRFTVTDAMGNTNYLKFKTKKENT
jgi:hypothetical protein